MADACRAARHATVNAVADVTGLDSVAAPSSTSRAAVTDGVAHYRAT